MSKQGLDQRFNARAARLMADLFQESLQAFKTEKKMVIDALKPFSGIKITDSSIIALPEQLQNLYRGFDGGGSRAALRMQVLMDESAGQLEIAKITEAVENDQTFKEHLEVIEKGTLYLQDLGYFNLSSLAAIAQAGSYFISRHLSTAAVFDEAEPIDLLVWLRKKGDFCSRRVRIGRKQHRIEVRLVAQRLGEREREIRLRKIKEAARAKGRTPTQRTLELAQWSIYLTNIPESWCRDEHIDLFYSLCWQIELFFKLCKSEAGIDQLSSKKAARVECEFYAKLICLVMFLGLSFPIRWQEKQEFSYRKGFKQFRQQSISFLDALRSPYRLVRFLLALSDDFKEFSLKDKCRKKKPSTYQKLMSITAQEILVKNEVLG